MNATLLAVPRRRASDVGDTGDRKVSSSESSSGSLPPFWQDSPASGRTDHFVLAPSLLQENTHFSRNSQWRLCHTELFLELS